jgi:CRISPR-associated endoribonuclease Cas6
MTRNLLYSLILELRAKKSVALPTVTGHQVHALFLHLLGQVEPELATRLHDDPEYRPFTISPLLSTQTGLPPNRICQDQRYRVRITLLDGGEIWQHLNRTLQEDLEQYLALDQGIFVLEHVLATPSSDPTGWADWTTWQRLALQSAQPTITLIFATPTAFHLGERHFILLPEPLLVWDSLMRKWNQYAPEALHIERTELRAFVEQNVWVSDHTLHTTTLTFPKYMQKGFVGSCTYLIKGSGGSAFAATVACLAEFARYAGVGYKTTMGMGQTRAVIQQCKADGKEIREARLRQN